MRQLLAVLISSLLLAACDFGFGGQCAALCIPSVKLSLVDAQGAPVNPGSGTVTIDGRTGAFDCASGSLSPVADGGTVVNVRCEGNVLTISDGPMPSQLELTVQAASGNLRFSGTVQQLTYQDTGERICGTRCMVASQTVTLR